MEFVKNPTTVKLMATQIIKACDSYIGLKMSEKQLRELIMYYASQHGKKPSSVEYLSSKTFVLIMNL
jgi:uncharacterized protein (TIGR04540 family)